MRYWFVSDIDGKRHVIVAENEHDLIELLKNAGIVIENEYELTPDTFTEAGFLISDK